jgi:hypothetical protein
VGRPHKLGVFATVILRFQITVRAQILFVSFWRAADSHDFLPALLLVHLLSVRLGHLLAAVVLGIKTVAPGKAGVALLLFWPFIGSTAQLPDGFWLEARRSYFNHILRHFPDSALGRLLVSSLVLEQFLLIE